jgi:hypothetical protein
MGEVINIQNPTILDILSDSSEFQDIPLEEYVQISNTMKLLGIKNFEPINITKGCKKPTDIIKLIQIINNKNKKYEYLNLRLCNVTDKVISEINKNLKALVLEESLIKNSNIQNNNILIEISKLDNLKYLSLKNNFKTYKNPITFDFSVFKNLTSIDLSYNYINITTIESLIQVKNLKYLNLEGANIITIIGNSIEYPFIGEIINDYIYKMKNLQYLNLNYIIGDEIYEEDIEEIQGILDELPNNLKKLKYCEVNMLPKDKRLIKFNIDSNEKIFNCKLLHP